MSLSDQELSVYLASLTPEQARAVSVLRRLVRKECPALIERIDEGKWYGGLLTYSLADGTPVYALGPRSGGFSTLHMLPYYCSTDLHQRHGERLRKFLSGKSCIKFKNVEDLPLDAITHIFQVGPDLLVKSIAARDERRRS